MSIFDGLINFQFLFNIFKEKNILFNQITDHAIFINFEFRMIRIVQYFRYSDKTEEAINPMIGSGHAALSENVFRIFIFLFNFEQIFSPSL